MTKALTSEEGEFVIIKIRKKDIRADLKLKYVDSITLWSKDGNSQDFDLE